MTFSLIDQYRELHKRKSYGDTSAHKAHYLLPYIRQLKPGSVIDYGCGQSALAEIIRASGVPDVYRYDPAIDAYASRPQRSFDLLVSVDVLEHVPETELDGVLADMRSLAPNAMLIIDTKPAKTVLPNGENAHVTVRAAEWWRKRLSVYYDCLEPFPFTAHRARACFKTWQTSSAHRKLLWLQSQYIRFRWRTAQTRAKVLQAISRP